MTLHAHHITNVDTARNFAMWCFANNTSPAYAFISSANGTEEIKAEGYFGDYVIPKGIDATMADPYFRQAVINEYNGLLSKGIIAWRPTLGPAVGRSETLLRSHGTPPLSFPLCLLFSVFSVYSKSTLSVSVSVSVVALTDASWVYFISPLQPVIAGAVDFSNFFSMLILFWCIPWLSGGFCHLPLGHWSGI